MATIKLSEVRSEMKQVKGTVSYCIKWVLGVKDCSPSLSKLCPNKKDFLSLSGRIYEDMGIGKTAYITRTDADFNKYKKPYIVKCSADTIYRWLVANQDKIDDIIASVKGDK